MKRQRLGSPDTPARIFMLGAGCGFIAGAMLAAALVSQSGNIAGSHRASAEHPAPAPTGHARQADGGIDDAGEAVIRGREVGTTGDSAPVAIPDPSPDPVIEAPPASELAGRDLMIPIEGVAADHLTQSFSQRRGSREHQAIDILAPRHTPVLAVEAGTVARLFYSEAGGITIYQFDPTDRFCYYYAHLERYADGLVEGQQVAKGEIIGYVGTSGNAPEDTPHLHFAIFRLSSAKRWWEGTPLDPFDVLR